MVDGIGIYIYICTNVGDILQPNNLWWLILLGCVYILPIFPAFPAKRSPSNLRRCNGTGRTTAREQKTWCSEEVHVAYGLIPSEALKCHGGTAILCEKKRGLLRHRRNHANQGKSVAVRVNSYFIESRTTGVPKRYAAPRQEFNNQPSSARAIPTPSRREPHALRC